VKKILGSFVLLAALALPAAAAESVLCRVSGYASAAVCSSQPAAVGVCASTGSWNGYGWCQRCSCAGRPPASAAA